MHWNYPQGNNSGSGGSNSSFRPQNELVANRQKNQAGIWNGDVKSIISSPLIQPVAGWNSPVFDLRPDLPFLSQGDESSTPVYRSKTGDWGSLWCIVEGLNQQFGAWFGFSNLRVHYQTFASPINPSIVRAVNNPIDITSEFSVDLAQPAEKQKQSTLLQFKATNDVDPIRYWQVKIYFSWSVTQTVPFQLRIQSSYY